jgi:hypothetical protein
MVGAARRLATELVVMKARASHEIHAVLGRVRAFAAAAALGRGTTGIPSAGRSILVIASLVSRRCVDAGGQHTDCSKAKKNGDAKASPSPHDRSV